MPSFHPGCLRAFASTLALAASAHAGAFCGFFVGKADTTLYNKASQVILVREGDRTVISMLNDYRGEPAQFALVVPVPQVLERGQIRVGDRKIFGCSATATAFPRAPRRRCVLTCARASSSSSRG